jgi:hypothetical protein
MSSHHDLLALLPDIHRARMGQEYDGNEPPDEVSPGAFAQRRNLRKAHRIILQVSLYVAFVAFQVEPIAAFDSDAILHPPYQCVEGFYQARDCVEICAVRDEVTGSGPGQHQPDPLSLLLSPLPRFGHLCPEVLHIKSQAIEQES